MKDFFLADAPKHRGRNIRSHFLVAQKQLRDRSDGAAKYLSLTLCDRTGRLDGRVWDNAETWSAKFEQNDFVDVRACVDEFNGKLQLRVTEIIRLDPVQIDLGDFQRKTTRDIERLWVELRSSVNSFSDPDLKRLVFAFLDDPEIARRYRAAPAAKFMHHAWIGGLLEHVVDLIEFCDLAASHFPLIHRDLLLTGAVLHDIGKIYELSWERGFEYTLEGQLIGHISIATRLLDEKVKSLPGFPKPIHMLVEHMILSHHGSFEFGSPKLPMIPEAVLLHYLDDAEAKMLAIQEACQPLSEGAAVPVYIDRVRALERPLVNTRAFLVQSETKEL
ncbi:MAG: OB-fold nucleic acid binding domain-containing protein [Terriglobia bacterium]|nr:OB-fold nucleic acid binding domain-containing protein [Terriglobia bacterium]